MEDTEEVEVVAREELEQVSSGEWEGKLEEQSQEYPRLEP